MFSGGNCRSASAEKDATSVDSVSEMQWLVLMPRFPSSRFIIRVPVFLLFGF